MATKAATKPRELSFSDIEKILFRDPDEKRPLEPVTDFRLAAGLLFNRYNDDTSRHIRIENGKPTLIVTWTASFTAFPRVDIPLDPTVIEELFRERAIEGTPEMGYTDMNKLRLSNRGKRLVLQQWIAGGGIHDFFEAGGSMDMGPEAKAHWPHDS